MVGNLHDVWNARRRGCGGCEGADVAAVPCNGGERGRRILAEWRKSERVSGRAASPRAVPGRVDHTLH
jgi:hypothetical protein